MKNIMASAAEVEYGTLFIQAVAKLLNYLATNPDAKIQYRASGMQLCVHSDDSYLSVSKARSRAGGIHFLSEGPPNPNESQGYAPSSMASSTLYAKS